MREINQCDFPLQKAREKGDVSFPPALPGQTRELGEPDPPAGYNPVPRAWRPQRQSRGAPAAPCSAAAGSGCQTARACESGERRRQRNIRASCDITPTPPAAGPNFTFLSPTACPGEAGLPRCFPAGACPRPRRWPSAPRQRGSCPRTLPRGRLRLVRPE